MSPQLLAYLMLESTFEVLAPQGTLVPENEERVDSLLDAMDNMWWHVLTEKDIATLNYISSDE